MHYYLVLWKPIWYSRCTKLTNAQFISFCASFLGNWFADGGGDQARFLKPPTGSLPAATMPPNQPNCKINYTSIKKNSQTNLNCQKKNIAKGTMDPRQWVFWLIQHLLFKAEPSTSFEIWVKLQVDFVWQRARIPFWQVHVLTNKRNLYINFDKSKWQLREIHVSVLTNPFNNLHEIHITTMTNPTTWAKFDSRSDWLTIVTKQSNYRTWVW